MDDFKTHFVRGLISTGILEGGRGENIVKIAKDAIQSATALASAVSSTNSIKDKKKIKAFCQASAGLAGVMAEEKIMNQERGMNESNKNNPSINSEKNESFFNKNFLVGALVGSSATFILMNPKIRNKIIKSVTDLWAFVSSEVEEMKEQFADAQAEQHSSKSDQDLEPENHSSVKKKSKKKK